MTAAFYVILADDLTFGYRTLFGSLPGKTQIINAMCVGEFETNSGRAWQSHGGAINIGAVQFRSLNATELTAYKSKQLKRYDTLSGNPGGILIDTDSDPNSGGFVAWYAAFAEQIDAAIYFLRAVFKTQAERAAADQSPRALATAMYQACYFGGVHPGARPCGQRSQPFNAAEEANINDYATNLERIQPTIANALASWAPDANAPPSAKPGTINLVGTWPGGSSTPAKSKALLWGLFGLAAFGATYYFRRPILKTLVGRPRRTARQNPLDNPLGPMLLVRPETSQTIRTWIVEDQNGGTVGYPKSEASARRLAKQRARIEQRTMIALGPNGESFIITPRDAARFTG